MAIILNFVDANREDALATAEENAWKTFLARTREMIEAQNRMHDAHKASLAIKYPKGTPK